MNYVLYDPSSGKISQYMEINAELHQSPVLGMEILEVPKQINTVVTTHSVKNGELVLLPTTVKLAIDSDIKSMWDRLSRLPIQINEGLFDIDITSLSRMENVIHTWDTLKDVPEYLNVVNGEYTISWKTADVSISCSKEKLSIIYESIKIALAKRTAELFISYQRIKSTPNVTLEYVSNSANWYSEV